MQQEVDFSFEALNQDINWTEAIVEEGTLLIDQLAEDEVGDADIQRVVNLFSMAEHAQDFAAFQAMAARLGDLCCNNPSVMNLVNGNEELNSVYQQSDSHDKCDDDDQSHDHNDKKDKDKKSKKKKKKRSWMDYFTEN